MEQTVACPYLLGSDPDIGRVKVCVANLNTTDELSSILDFSQMIKNSWERFKPNKILILLNLFGCFIPGKILHLRAAQKLL